MFSTASCTGTHAARPTCKWSENGNKQWNKNLLMILANWEEQREGQTDRNYGSFYETNCLNSKTEDENLQCYIPGEKTNPDFPYKTKPANQCQ